MRVIDLGISVSDASVSDDEGNPYNHPDYTKPYLEETLKGISEEKNIDIYDLNELYAKKEVNIENLTVLGIDKSRDEITKPGKKNKEAQLPGNTRRIMTYKNNYYRNQDTFVKLYRYAYFGQNIVLAKILSEIYFQKLAENISQECRFYVPIITRYGFIKGNDELRDDIGSQLFYIQMEYVNGIKLYDIRESLPDKYNEIRQKVRKIEDCQTRNDLFHNDLNDDNIIINELDKIYIIDYGETSTQQALMSNLTYNLPVCDRSCIPKPEKQK